MSLLKEQGPVSLHNRTDRDRCSNPIACHTRRSLSTLSSLPENAWRSRTSATCTRIQYTLPTIVWFLASQMCIFLPWRAGWPLWDIPQVNTIYMYWCCANICPLRNYLAVFRQLCNCCKPLGSIMRMRASVKEQRPFALTSAQGTSAPRSLFSTKTPLLDGRGASGPCNSAEQLLSVGAFLRCSQQFRATTEQHMERCMEKPLRIAR